MASRKQAPAKSGAKPKTKPKAGKAGGTKASRYAPSGLLWGHETFAIEYCKDRNATQAAIRAGYSKKTAGSQGFDFLKKPEIRKRITEIISENAKSLNIEVSDVLQIMWDRATGDVNDLVRLEHRCCRYCWGKDHEFQWKTTREFREAYDGEIRKQFGDDIDKMSKLARKFDGGQRIPGMPTDIGGYGYDPTASPNPECPECAGEGIERVAMADTREAMSHPLYEGVKETQHGIEIKIADRDKALENVAKHLQMFKEQVSLDVSEEFIKAAKAISNASPALDPEYMRKNASRLTDEGGDT